MRRETPMLEAGSSPRARGTLKAPDGGKTRWRIIPACAGNTAERRVMPRPASDHPRVRGEHSFHRARANVAVGSSPRARGTPVRSTAPYQERRIIPACAGNTTSARSSNGGSPDHPRVRGEHHREPRRAKRRAGSSPRARGTQLEQITPELVTRIIPACAGNTCDRDGRDCTGADHPRVRGEHPGPNVSSDHATGSSPRARGTRARRMRSVECSRIIPACAGNTLTSRTGREVEADHPRVRGEHPTVTEPMAQAGGSSPRARGTPCRR